MHSMTVSTSVLTDDAARADQRLTPTLLLAGAAAGPLYVGVSLVQALTRDGFDVTRHPWSLLTNGNLGWIQVLNFLITGVLTIACAEGMRRAHAGNLGPVLVAGFGLGMIAAGIFTADPMDGFPRGTPAGPPASISWHGILHLVCASLGFLAMIIACFVFARRFGARGRRGWAWYSVATGIVFFAAFAGVASGSSNPAVVLSFVSSVVLVFVWLAVVAVDLATRTT